MKPNPIHPRIKKSAILCGVLLCVAAFAERGSPPVSKRVPAKQPTAVIGDPTISAPSDTELEAAIADDLVEPTPRPRPQKAVPRGTTQNARPSRSSVTKPLNSKAAVSQPENFNSRTVKPRAQSPTPMEQSVPGDGQTFSVPIDASESLESTPGAAPIEDSFQASDPSLPEMGEGPGGANDSSNGMGAMPPMVPKEPPLTLAESFSAEKNPGRGTLTYKHLEQNEVIELGAETGQFGFGLVFRHATLPEEFIREYGKVDVIQFSFGTLPSKAQGRIPEFGTMAVFSKTKPKQWTAFPLMTGVQRQMGQDFGLILFSSPKAPVQRSDEEKLRDTYFSKSGQIRLMSTGSIKGLDVEAEGKRVSFKVQAMKMEVDADLSTPFNAQKHQLQGTVDIPVYWPESPAALNWMKKIALRSLLATNVVSAPRTSASSPTRLEESEAKDQIQTGKKRKRLPKGM